MFIKLLSSASQNQILDEFKKEIIFAQEIYLFKHHSYNFHKHFIIAIKYIPHANKLYSLEKVKFDYLHNFLQNTTLQSSSNRLSNLEITRL